MKHSTRRYRFMTLMALLILAGSLLPASTALADTQVPRPLTQTNSDYVRGQFGLTALVEDGGIQIMPLGSLRTVTPANKALCYPVAYAGTASYTSTVNFGAGPVTTSYFYLVGGQTNATSSSGVPVTVDTTCYSRINNQNGDLADFTTSPKKLPKPIRENQAVAVRAPNNQGYLYSFGGATDPLEQSVASIYRAPINDSDGSLGDWVELPVTMPRRETDPSGTNGRHAFAIAAVEAKDGNTYIYIFGGLTRYIFSSSVEIIYRRDNWRTKVNNDGSLDPWTRLPDTPITTDIKPCAGLFRAEAANFPVFYTVDNVTNYTDTVYLMGGLYQGNRNLLCDQAETISASVYRASIHADGNLVWDSNPNLAEGNPDRNIFTTDLPLYQHRAVGLNQKLYIIGGSEGNTTSAAPTRTIRGSLAMSSQDLITVSDGSSSSNFYVNPNVLPRALYGHSVQRGVFNNLPMFFIFGGRTSATGNQNFVNEVSFSIPSKDEEGTKGYPKEDAYYLSEVYDLRGSAKLLDVQWSGTITTGLTLGNDIQISYRMAATRNELFAQPWQVIDNNVDPLRYSQTGVSGAITNTFTLPSTPEVTGRYLQYRAVLRSLDGVSTPILRKVWVNLEFKGFPNLRVETAGMTDVNIGPVVRLTNRPGPVRPTDPVLDANIGGDGSFFVDMYVYGPDEDPVPPQLDTAANGGALKDGEYYVELPKSQLPANTSYTIPTGDWEVFCPTAPVCPKVNWLQVFNKPGTWTVYLIVDSSNTVREGESIGGGQIADWEQDNLYSFTVESTGSVVYMPTVRR